MMHADPAATDTEDTNLYDAITTQLRETGPTPRHRLVGTIAHEHPVDYDHVKAVVDELERDGILYVIPDKGVQLTHA